ncbi:hypothetical protein NKH77_21905 [Streptomyces sp. M19]
MIRFDAVSKHYPNGTTAVHDLTLDLPEGGVTVLVGTSGAARRPRCGWSTAWSNPAAARSTSPDRTSARRTPPNCGAASAT